LKNLFKTHIEKGNHPGIACLYWSRSTPTEINRIKTGHLLRMNLHPDPSLRIQTNRHGKEADGSPRVSSPRDDLYIKKGIACEYFIGGTISAHSAAGMTTGKKLMPAITQD
jgi:hypothetical protein